MFNLIPQLFLYLNSMLYFEMSVDNPSRNLVHSQSQITRFLDNSLFRSYFQCQHSWKPSNCNLVSCSHHLSLNYCLWSYHSPLPCIFQRFCNSWLMQISLCRSEIDSFRRSNDAKIDHPSTCLGDERVKDFVVVYKKVNVKPKRVSKYYFSELKGSSLGRYIFLAFRDIRFPY